MRGEIRNLSKRNKYVEESQQSCSIDENRNILCKLLDAYTDETRIAHLKALLYIWDSLLAEVDGRRRASMLFSEAYDVFIAFSQPNALKDLAHKDFNLQNQFRFSLLHAKYGLRIVIVRHNDECWILLHPDNFHLDNFFQSYNEVKEKRKNLLNKDLLQNLLLWMDSEWDRKVVRYILSLLFTRNAIDNLGVDSDSIGANRDAIETFLASLVEIEESAEADIADSLRRQKTNLATQITNKRRILIEKQLKWNQTQIDERKEEIEDINQKISKLDALLEQRNEDESWKKRVSRRKKRIIEERKLKKRKSNHGRPRLVDINDELYVAKCIEEKATAHGRRHDSVLYLNHRVKKKDFLKLVNHNHRLRGLPPIKSAMTIYNRGRAKRLNSRQAKRHIGRSLFCCKKSPKSEGRDNLLTHHCRAYKKNVIRQLYAKVGADLRVFPSGGGRGGIPPTNPK